jgi:hypothetical protein
MKCLAQRSLGFVAPAVARWLCNGEMLPTACGFLMADAEAWVDQPLTPVSYAGVAHRTRVRAVTPGAGTGQTGAGYSGGVNSTGPVNRVGVR